jgi:integrase/recombinase XerC
LLPVGVAHLDEAEAVFEAMLVGFANRQLSRELNGRTIRAREKTLRRFVAFSDAMPWEWTPAHFEGWSAVHVRGGLALSTVRSYQGTVALFVEYVTDLRNDWVAECERRFGRAPLAICGEHNMVRRNTDYEGVPDGNRPLSKEELARFFSYANARVDEARSLQRKGVLAAYRDAVLYLVIYAWGLRRNEAAHLKVSDFRANAAHPAFGEYGQLVVRYGKARKGGPARRRTVLTVWGWAVAALGDYLADARPCFFEHHPDAGWLFPSERGGHVSVGHVDHRFAEYRAAAGLDVRLVPHCLRHTYVTRLLEAGYPLSFVQEQVGHSHAATTAIYTAVSNDFKNRAIAEAITRSLAAGGARGG